jgi:hypothetical protein
MVSIFRRRRRRGNVDVGTYVAPPPAPIAPVESVVHDGVLISLWSVRMAIKNRLIVAALRDGEPFDQDALAAAAREEIIAVAEENEDSAQRLEDRREELDSLEDGLDLSQISGSGVTARRPVAENEEHRRRPHVHRLLAAALRSTADDEEAVANLVAGASQDAMEEVGREILKKAAARAELPEFVPEDDEEYAEQRPIRMRMLLDFDLAELEHEAQLRHRASAPPSEDRWG